jgi:hypothetical protein
VVYWRKKEAIQVPIFMAMDETSSAATVYATDVLPLFLLEVGPSIESPLENDDA